MSSRTYRALLIANSTFPNDAQNLPDLEGPRNDPALLRDALCDGASGLFPSDNIRLVTERTMAEVLRETEDFLTSASRQDTLLLYYSGHGMLDQRGELFLCTRDSRADRLRSTAVKASDLRGMLDESAALTTVILLDCCHSGRFKGGILPATLAGRGRFVVTSSRGGELANDADVRNRASLFTFHLTEGLVRGAEDHDGDGVVNLSELYDYVHTALVAEGRQVPQKRFEGDGDVPVALRTVTPDHAQLDLVAPAAVAPALDLSDTVVDLGDVEVGEVLPPERIAVINRGGGTLEWTVESSADWVDAVAEETGVVLHLKPPPGPNRANVYVRDRLSGELKTIRVSVRVRPAPGMAAAVTVPLAAPEPLPAPEPAAAVAAPEPAVMVAAIITPTETTAAEPAAPPPPGATGGSTAPFFTVAAGAMAVVAGVLLMVTGFLASDVAGSPGLVRNGPSPGLLAVIIAGGVLVPAGVVVVRSFRAGSLLGFVAALALPTGFERLAEHGPTSDCGCPGVDDVAWFRGAGVLCLLAAALAIVALIPRRPVSSRSWIPVRLHLLAVAAAAVWAASTFFDIYEYYGDPYGNYTAFRGVAGHVLAVASVVAIVVAVRWLVADVGREALSGVAILPALIALSEIIYVARSFTEGGLDLWGVLYLAVPAAVLVLAAVLVGKSSAHRAPAV